MEQTAMIVEILHRMDAVDIPGTGETCAVCGTVLGSRVAVRLNNSRLCECEACGSWTYLPRLDIIDQSGIHDTEQYFEHPYFALRRAVSPAQRRRCRDVFARLSVALDIGALRGQRLLDIGCDTGTFVKTAQEEFGIVPVGVDVAGRALRVALERGVEAYHTCIEDAPQELMGFRVITAIDLIEHVPNPLAFLTAVRSRLAPGGLLYLETPHIGSTIYRFGRTLAGLTRGRPTGLLERLFPPQHTQYFTPASLCAVAQSAGFQVADMGTRVLPSSDIAVSRAVLVAIGALQACDRVLGTGILIWAVLRLPDRL